MPKFYKGKFDNKIGVDGESLGRRMACSVDDVRRLGHGWCKHGQRSD